MSTGTTIDTVINKFTPRQIAKADWDQGFVDLVTHQYTTVQAMEYGAACSVFPQAMEQLQMCFKHVDEVSAEALAE